jgi:hypothetical protein
MAAYEHQSLISCLHSAQTGIAAKRKTRKSHTEAQNHREEFEKG